MAAASGNQLTESRTHFAHPQHPLLKTQYGGGERQPSSRHVCRICGTRVVAGAGYRCDHCDFDIHEACADFFPEKMITPPPNFFGHPWSHNLALRQVTAADGSWPCTLCRGPFQHGHLAYRCGARRCGFAAHPLCTMLPGEIRSPLHRKHALTHTELIPSRLTSGPCKPAEMARVCSVCRRDCSTVRTRHYRCASCMFVLHIGGCVSGVPPPPAPDGEDQGSSGPDGARGSCGGAAAAPAPAVARFLVVVAEQQLAADFPAANGMVAVINALQASLSSND
ncbi:uncharacterized protein LOC127780715 [Oryza glaberrima]|uniref:uncharacterized protein LOC127780715 n=1 Tax=Oryza glaberrima TaxID=4538 RepID=UPI00023E3CF4|nr:uncharacterized protein LOC127780715 [Oryza glaberrima]